MPDSGLDDAAFAKIDHRPLRQQIADRLQEAILDGELKPGQAIVETEVASWFGVSRAPVREALQILSSRQLLTTEPYRGTFVRRLDRRDVEEAYSLRTALEAFAVRRVIAGAPGEAAQELRLVCERMKASAEANDPKSLLVHDDAFHHTLIQRADHALLASVWQEIRYRVRQIMALRNLQNLDIMEIFYNHLPIVEAIEAGDERAAVARIEQHIASAEDLMLADELFDDGSRDGVQDGSQDGSQGGA